MGKVSFALSGVILVYSHEASFQVSIVALRLATSCMGQNEKLRHFCLSTTNKQNTKHHHHTNKDKHNTKQTSNVIGTAGVWSNTHVLVRVAHIDAPCLFVCRSRNNFHSKCPTYHL